MTKGLDLRRDEEEAVRTDPYTDRIGMDLRRDEEEAAIKAGMREVLSQMQSEEIRIEEAYRSSPADRTDTYTDRIEEAYRSSPEEAGSGKSLEEHLMEAGEAIGDGGRVMQATTNADLEDPRLSRLRETERLLLNSPSTTETMLDQARTLTLSLNPKP